MINTYGMDDINTQAIRELTTEVERAKLKQASDKKSIDDKISAIETELGALHPNFKYKQCYATGLNYVIAGGAVIRQSISVTPSTGYMLKSASLRYAGQRCTPSIAPVVCFYSFPSDDSTVIYFGLINTGGTSVTDL